MQRDLIHERMREGVLILDGAMGTELQMQGLPAGACPEAWALDHVHVLEGIHRAYAEAGSDVVTTNTFGANRIKLAHFGREARTIEINILSARAARRAVDPGRLVAGSVGPLGRLVEPGGEVPFDRACEYFSEQIKGLAEGGVDVILIETMMDVQEARCALLAAKDVCDLPVWVSMTFENDRTLTGSDPVTALITLQAMGADVVGTNCGNGPEQMLPIIEAMRHHATVPLLVQPNAGMPRSVNGQTVFTLSGEEFTRYAWPLCKAGASLIGGCCGTDPGFIHGLTSEVKGAGPHPPLKTGVSALTSCSRTVFLGPRHPTAIIGEQLNPSGKPELSQQLAAGEITIAREIGVRMADQGADIININVGAPFADQVALMKKLVMELSVAVDTPLSLDSADARPIEEAIRLYPGRALINSISGERSKRDILLPLAKRYGAMFVLMPIDEQGVPRDAAKRLAIIRDVVAEAESLSIDRSAIIVDALVLAQSSNPGRAEETIKVIRACTHELGLMTMCGLSNISFGLPQRPWLDAAFLAMCSQAGISAVNANPGSEHHRSILAACDVLTGRDSHALRYIERMKTPEKPKIDKKPEETAAPVDALYEAVLHGRHDAVTALMERELAKGRAPMDMINGSLVPAITEVGRRFSCHELFLPQLMLSSRTIQTAFERLESAHGEEAVAAKGTVLLATVKGDIHDIGKNLVGVLLKNHGFNVIDAGMNVDPEAILDAARAHHVDIVGLSALMTTTMSSMRDTIRSLRENGVTAPIMVGGAVLNEEYARDFGADGYARDAVEAVRLAIKLIEKS